MFGDAVSGRTWLAGLYLVRTRHEKKKKCNEVPKFLQQDQLLQILAQLPRRKSQRNLYDPKSMILVYYGFQFGGIL